MARDTSTDQITNDLIQRYVTILSPLAGWGVLRPVPPAPTGLAAVYPQLGLPTPQQPFPAAYIYVRGLSFDWTLLHQGIRKDIYTLGIRLLGGEVTPYTVVAGGLFNGDYPEIAVYKMLTACINELTYRPFLNDPTTNEAFRYLSPDSKASVLPIGQVTGFSYGEKQAFIGIEIPASVTLQIKIGRVS